MLKNYWRNIDPFDANGQFCDRGDSYKPVIFYNDDYQRSIAEESFKNVQRELSVSLKTIGVILKKNDR